MSSIATPCDVLVVGAGAAGVTSAVTAARLGCRTVLLERQAALGGVMTDGFCFPVCGLFENDTSRPPRLLNDGLCAAFYTAVRSADPEAVRARGRVYVCRCHAGLLRQLFHGWLDHPNITYYSSISDVNVVVDNRTVTQVRFVAADGSVMVLQPAQVIDCSGAGTVIRQSGAGTIEPAVLPLAGYVLSLDGVGGDDELLPVFVSYQMRKAADAGLLPTWGAFTFLEVDPSAPDRAALKFNFPANAKVEQVKSITREALHILCARLPGFRYTSIRGESRSVLPREGSRLLGMVVLSENDVRTGARFPDAAASGGWPMEYWDEARGPQYTFPEHATSYDVPARCLRSVTIRNLRAAGRCVSADSMALSSLRVSGTCMALGEAAARDAVA